MFILLIYTPCYIRKGFKIHGGQVGDSTADISYSNGLNISSTFYEDHVYVYVYLCSDNPSSDYLNLTINGRSLCLSVCSSIISTTVHPVILGGCIAEDPR